MSFSSIDPATRDALRKYLREVKGLPNEAAKRSRFGTLIGELFPGSSAVEEFSRGIEKTIHINTLERDKRGRADAFCGQAVVEFEKSLAATLAEAERQLREYVAGLWQSDGDRPRSLYAIASDGVEWRTYRPLLAAGAKPSPETVSLELLQEIKLSEETLSTFWLWLTNQLFRPQRLEPTAEHFQYHFGSWSYAFSESMAALKRAWAQVHEQSEAKLAFTTWQRYLTVTYGRLAESKDPRKDIETGALVSELEEFFLRHTYLSSFARLLVWAALSKGKTNLPYRRVASEVLSGRYFQSKRLANLAEDDFFHWTRNAEAEELLAPAWERVIAHLLEFDLGALREDVLKGIYQQLIGPKERHDLGEYYTPDWLCEQVVEEVLPATGFPAVLDPTCGSGSFLRAAIHHLLERNPEGTAQDRLRAILQSVVGIDIHPVAVTIARATYVLALGPLVNSAKRAVQIPVYLADSLFLPNEVTLPLQQLEGIEISFGGESVVLPHGLVYSPNLFDDAISACAGFAEDHAKSKKESRLTLGAHLSRTVPDLSKLLEHESAIDTLWEFTQKLAQLIRDRKDTIWSFIIRNSYRPAMLRGQFDCVVGNPPWLAYRYISDPDYQAEVKKRAVETYWIAPRQQKLFTQMELATVFLAHAMEVFAKPGARLGFVMPRSILSADQHQNLVQRSYRATFRITGYWDLWDVSPLFNVPSAVLFAKRESALGSSRDVLPVKTWSGKLPGNDVPWSVAAQRLTAKKEKARTIWLGSRCALSTQPGALTRGRASNYQKAFKQGATIVPRSFYFVTIQDFDGNLDADRTYWCHTEPEQAKLAKPPYDEVHMSGEIEGKFLFASGLAKHVMPFAVLEPAPVVLPLKVDKNGMLRVQKRRELLDEGYRKIGKWMEKAEQIWSDKREQKSGRQDVYEWLDYQGKLSNQDLKHRFLVLYNAAGTNVSAALFDRRQYSLPFIVDHKMYWAAFSDVNEAHYITAILNSEAVNEAIKPFQSTGLMGERDIHKKLLDLPIPTYDAKIKAHQRLSTLGASAAAQASELARTSEFLCLNTLARRRAMVRGNLNAVLSQIDGLTRELLLSSAASAAKGG